eukprot:GHVS01051850.1.p2 GENE.GHVS01051850.1~~GHVS01051850.1.p2  ORF type:complete len:482 (-),score=99.74 GHVS01051850.1:2857-4233(-)
MTSSLSSVVSPSSVQHPSYNFSETSTSSSLAASLSSSAHSSPASPSTLVSFSALRSAYMRSAPIEVVLQLCRDIQLMACTELQDRFVSEVIYSYPCCCFPPNSRMSSRLLKALIVESDIAHFPLADSIAIAFDQIMGGFSSPPPLCVCRPRCAKLHAEGVSFVSYQLPAALVPKHYHNEQPTPYNTMSFRLFKERNEVGLRTWTGGMYLSEYLYGQRSVLRLRGARVLELGGGVGITAVSTARLCGVRELVATDKCPHVLYNLKMNVHINCIQLREKYWETERKQRKKVEERGDFMGASSVSFEIFDWELKLALLSKIQPNAATADQSPADWAGIDLVIGSDLVYDPKASNELVGALTSLLQVPVEKEDEKRRQEEEDVEEQGEVAELVSSCLKRGKRYAIIVCTVRDADEFALFLSTLKESGLKCVEDEETVVRLFDYDRSNIRVLIIADGVNENTK